MSKVSGSRRFSFLDGFSGYNQVLVKESDRYKTTFTTKWGTYAYCKMPFGLTNAGATFQKAMEVAFKKLIDKFVLVYLDDITVYSKNVEDRSKPRE
ncbi:reverse transcriptase family protein [Enterobacter hormaechei]|uniref:reverse transcriptase family protein n=1 Tax=Enterobacter hormaechei TaxID=158836 RepID=UPI0023E4776D|nr:reverse transcriptase family protein [Enterobacter hormaechei]MDF3686197.1 reverse transcriptase family protein [Enterobacter hormaechei]